jgi:hypothetical protein
LFFRDELLIDRVAFFSNTESFYSSHLSGELLDKFKSLGGEITDVVALSVEQTLLFLNQLDTGHYRRGESLP